MSCIINQGLCRSDVLLSGIQKRCVLSSGWHAGACKVALSLSSKQHEFDFVRLRVQKQNSDQQKVQDLMCLE